MSIFGGLLRSTAFDNPQVAMNAENLAYFLDLFGGGRSESNEIVTPMTAMQLTTVFSCVRILSQQAGKLPLHVYASIANGKTKAKDHPAYDLLNKAPNSRMTAMAWKQSVVAQQMLWGAAYAEIQRNNGGQAVAIWPRSAWATRAVAKDGDFYFETTDNPQRRAMHVNAEDMLYFPYVTLDGVTPLSPIGCARQMIGLNLALDKFGGRFFGNYATPKLALEVPGEMAPEDKTKARNDWEALQSGSNQHRVAILDNGMKIVQLSIPPEDAQFIASHQLTKREICGLYGVPPHMTGDLDKAIKANVEQQGIELYQYTLSPVLTGIEQECDRKLMPTIGRAARKYTVGFDVSDLLRPDAASRQAYYQSGIQNGYLVQNEVREKEGLNAYEGNEIGWQPSIQLNMQPLANMSAAKPEPPEKEDEDGEEQ